MIHVIATIDAKPDCKQAILTELLAIRPEVLLEDGCLEYTPLALRPNALGMEVTNHPNRLTLVEKWASEEHLKRHLETEHFLRYKAATEDLVEAVSINVFEPLA